MVDGTSTAPPGPIYLFIPKPSMNSTASKSLSGDAAKPKEGINGMRISIMTAEKTQSHIGYKRICHCPSAFIFQALEHNNSGQMYYSGWPQGIILIQYCFGEGDFEIYGVRVWPAF